MIVKNERDPSPQFPAPRHLTYEVKLGDVGNWAAGSPGYSNRILTFEVRIDVNSGQWSVVSGLQSANNEQRATSNGAEGAMASSPAGTANDRNRYTIKELTAQRPLSRRDIDRLRHLYRLFYSRLPEKELEFEESLQDWLDDSVPVTVWVALDRTGVIQGYVMANLRLEDFEAEIESLMVAANQRGLGIGTSLILVAMRTLSAIDGIDAIVVWDSSALIDDKDPGQGRRTGRILTKSLPPEFRFRETRKDVYMWLKSSNPVANRASSPAGKTSRGQSKIISKYFKSTRSFAMLLSFGIHLLFIIVLFFVNPVLASSLLILTLIYIGWKVWKTRVQEEKAARSIKGANQSSTLRSALIFLTILVILLPAVTVSVLFDETGTESAFQEPIEVVGGTEEVTEVLIMDINEITALLGLQQEEEVSEPVNIDEMSPQELADYIASLRSRLSEASEEEYDQVLAELIEEVGEENMDILIFATLENISEGLSDLEESFDDLRESFDDLAESFDTFSRQLRIVSYLIIAFGVLFFVMLLRVSKQLKKVGASLQSIQSDWGKIQSEFRDIQSQLRDIQSDFNEVASQIRTQMEQQQESFQEVSEAVQSLPQFMKNYYAILETKPGASQEDIEGSYRSLSAKYEKYQGADNELAVQRIGDIEEAYRVLSDPAQRARYDQLLNFNQSQAPPTENTNNPDDKPDTSSSPVKNWKKIVSSISMTLAWPVLFGLPLFAQSSRVERTINRDIYALTNRLQDFVNVAGDYPVTVAIISIILFTIIVRSVYEALFLRRVNISRHDLLNYEFIPTMMYFPFINPFEIMIFVLRIIKVLLIISLSVYYIEAIMRPFNDPDRYDLYLAAAFYYMFSYVAKMSIAVLSTAIEKDKQYKLIRLTKDSIDILNVTTGDLIPKAISVNSKIRGDQIISIWLDEPYFLRIFGMFSPVLAVHAAALEGWRPLHKQMAKGFRDVKEKLHLGATEKMRTVNNYQDKANSEYGSSPIQGNYWSWEAHEAVPGRPKVPMRARFEVAIVPVEDPIVQKIVLYLSWQRYSLLAELFKLLKALLWALVEAIRRLLRINAPPVTPLNVRRSIPPVVISQLSKLPVQHIQITASRPTRSGMVQTQQTQITQQTQETRKPVGAVVRSMSSPVMKFNDATWLHYFEKGLESGLPDRVKRVKDGLAAAIAEESDLSMITGGEYPLLFALVNEMSPKTTEVAKHMPPQNIPQPTVAGLLGEKSTRDKDSAVAKNVPLPDQPPVPYPSEASGMGRGPGQTEGLDGMAGGSTLPSALLRKAKQTGLLTTRPEQVTEQSEVTRRRTGLGETSPPCGPAAADIFIHDPPPLTVPVHVGLFQFQFQLFRMVLTYFWVSVRENTEWRMSEDLLTVPRFHEFFRRLAAIVPRFEWTPI